MADVLEKVAPHAKNPQWRVLTVGGKDFITFNADLADALKVGTALPEGTTEEPPKFEGALPSLRLPRKGSGGTAWRNTKEGFEAEQAGRRRWQEIEEERKDRRTALMTAFERTPVMPGTDDWELILAGAERMYDWLRSSPAAGPPTNPERGGAGVATKPTASAGVAGVGAGGTSSGSGGGKGKAAPEPDTEPGETSDGTSPSALSPGSTIFPVDPKDCTHRFPSGSWLRWNAQGLCPKCGTPKIVAMESTTEDLGPA